MSVSPNMPQAYTQLRGWQRLLFAVVLVASLSACSGLAWAATSPDGVLRTVLGIPNVAPEAIPYSVVVSIDPHVPVFTPRAAVVRRGSQVVFANQLSTSLRLITASGSPQRLSLVVAPRGRRSVLLTQLGLYHYFDATSSRAGAVVAGNQIVRSRLAGLPPREGWIIVVPGTPGLQTRLVIPNGNDLFTPKAITATVGSTIQVANGDTDAHNFVVDPASPAGAAFIVSGTNDEPPHGWQRSLVVQQPGLYHVYCTLHTHRVSSVGGWQVVAPRSSASGYKAHNPMEAWIIVLPATAR